MTAATIITGPRENRTDEAARAGIPMSAANVRFILAEMESQVKSEVKRRKQAAFFGTNARCITDEARKIYMAYAAGAKLS